MVWWCASRRPGRRQAPLPPPITWPRGAAERDRHRPIGHQAISTAAAPGEGAKGHRRTPEGRGGDNGSAKAAERRAPTRGTTRAAADSSHPAEHRSSSKQGRVRGVCTEGGRAPQKPSHPSGGGRRSAHPGPFSGAFVHFRPVSRFSAFSDLSARWLFLCLWLLLICGFLCYLVILCDLIGGGGRLLGNGW